MHLQICATGSLGRKQEVHPSLHSTAFSTSCMQVLHIDTAEQLLTGVLFFMYRAVMVSVTLRTLCLFPHTSAKRSTSTQVLRSWDAKPLMHQPTAHTAERMHSFTVSPPNGQAFASVSCCSKSAPSQPTPAA